MSKRLSNLVERDGAFHEISDGFVGRPALMGPERSKDNLISYNHGRKVYHYQLEVHKTEEFKTLGFKLKNLEKNKFNATTEEMEEITGLVKKYNSLFEVDNYRDIKLDYAHEGYVRQVELSVEGGTLYLFSDGDVVAPKGSLEKTEFEGIKVHNITTLEQALDFGIMRNDINKKKDGYYLSSKGLKELEKFYGYPCPYSNNLFKSMMREYFSSDISSRLEILEEIEKAHALKKESREDKIDRIWSNEDRIMENSRRIERRVEEQMERANERMERAQERIERNMERIERNAERIQERAGRNAERLMKRW